VEFVVDKVALGQVFSEYFGFPCQPSITITITRGWYNRPVVAAVPKVSLHKLKKKRSGFHELTTISFRIHGKRVPNQLLSKNESLCSNALANSLPRNGPRATILKPQIPYVRKIKFYMSK
jgi:hypothetical protein